LPNGGLLLAFFVGIGIDLLRDGVRDLRRVGGKEEPPSFPVWLRKQGDDISVQDALDDYIAIYNLDEQVDDVPEDLTRQRVEIALLEQLRTMYGKSVSPEFSDLLYHKKLALGLGEDGLKMKREGRKAILEALHNSESIGDTKIRFRCPQCQTKYSALLDQAGRQANCKNCGKAIEVPKP